MTTLLIARHGNTFAAGDLVVRVGLRSDLPLVESGKEQAKKLGRYIIANKINISAVFTSTLARTIETATIALSTAQIKVPIYRETMFNEIDYGPDEGKTDQDVIARIGSEALSNWDSDAIAPPGWLVEPQHIIQQWREFGAAIATNYPHDTVLVITSNGIARFAPYLTEDYDDFKRNFKIKMATGAISSMSNDSGNWEVDFWNRTTD